MKWVAPSGKDTNNAALEKSLWDSDDQFRANSKPRLALEITVPFIQ